MSTVRLLAPDQAPLLARPYYENGPPDPITAALAHVPELMTAALPFIGAALGPSALSRRTKELVIVRVSALMRCRFCVQTHTVVALNAGLSHAEVRALRGEGSIAEAFPDPAERAVLAWAESVSLGPGPVDPAARALITEHFREHEIVELTVLAGATLLLNRFATALELPTGDGTLRRLAEEGLA